MFSHKGKHRDRHIPFKMCGVCARVCHILIFCHLMFCTLLFCSKILKLRVKSCNVIGHMFPCSVRTLDTWAQEPRLSPHPSPPPLPHFHPLRPNVKETQQQVLPWLGTVKLGPDCACVMSRSVMTIPCAVRVLSETLRQLHMVKEDKT